MIQILPNHRHLFFATDDDESFDDYIATTVDPGDTLLIISVFICLGSILSLPLFVKLGKWIESHKQSSSDRSEDCTEEGNANAECTEDNPAHNTSPNIFVRCLTLNRRQEAVSRGMAREARASVYRHEQEKQGAPAHANLEGGIELPERHEEVKGGGTPELIPEEQKEDTPINSQESAKNTEQVESQNPENSEPHQTRRSTIRKSIGFMWNIAKYDYETKRILRLAVPFTFSAIAETVSDLVILGIIDHFISTDAMVAYAMVDMLCGISSEFMGGWIEAISSLGSMAYGAKNYELVGSYAQAACIGYVLCEIPCIFVWGYTIGTILGWMGFDKSVIEIAEGYVWVQVALDIMEGVNEAILDFLEVIEYEAFANVMDCLSSLVAVGLVAIFAIKLDTTLVVLGLVMLVNEALFFFLIVLIPSGMGWLKKFELGLFGHCACSNREMLKELVSVALPLAFGDLLAYAEWEILTFFAAFLGPAEAATWAVLGFLWDVFESTTEAIGDASEVRCSYQLGKGRPALAKLSSYKSIFLATCVALVVTATFLSLADVLPSWLTKDETIQSMLSELFPLIALGNITMNMGMVCWALVGAQGRYRLATTVAMACSFFITLPLGAMFTIWLKVDLQGLTFSVVVGYTITAMILSIIVLVSDWETLSNKIQDRVAVDDGSDSDDDSDDDSSSSSSSESSNSSTPVDSLQQSNTARPFGSGLLELPPSFPEVLTTSPHSPRPHNKETHQNSLPGPPTDLGSASSDEHGSHGSSCDLHIMTPTRKQTNIAEHATGSFAVVGLLPFLPRLPKSPNDVSLLHDSQNSNGEDQTFNNISSSSKDSPSYHFDGISPSQIVKGRRKRIS